MNTGGVFADLFDSRSSSLWRRLLTKNVCTLCDEPLCSGEAYAAISARDDCNFSFKPFHDFRSLW
jgi:hypothetical protein